MTKRALITGITSRMNALFLGAKKPLREGLEEAYAWFVDQHGEARI